MKSKDGIGEEVESGKMSDWVKLIGAVGVPASHRVELALKLKGIPYEFIAEDLSNKSPLLLEYNPVHQKVPILLHNGKPRAESLVVIEYIDETWKTNPILPHDPYHRAMARFWAKFIDEKCVGGLWNTCWSAEAEREKAVEEGLECLKMLEDTLEGKRFFGGETIGMVDIVPSYVAFWLGVIEEVSEVKLLTEEKVPGLFRWTEEFLSCVTIQEGLPAREKIIGYLRARFRSE
ncbi:hypothetical protein SLEP1_g17875 [Rubroshorea leprosula]|uniref:glutathione transferase n=1 Tax=Rubroshorea leprosula TaxID=152421 RepID=A0AAV5J4R7_9ROSI|nr:hypothetical protein SLEP1_g17875 [Rubroshorea leprosula]